MRIAIPQHQGAVAGAYELSKSISLHLLDFAGMQSQDEGLLEFPGTDASFGWLAERDVDAVLVGTIEPDNAQSLADRGIHVFTGADDLSPTENVDRFLKLMREALTRSHQGGGCCGGHGHQHGGESEGGCCGGHGHHHEDDHECCGGGGEDCCQGEGHADPEHVCRCR
ncbi:MAG TPA: hypothetical protein PKO15_08690 [Fibrobacteria bacterium]|nr:hypothetical protein [Fibrobacteria bacterium]HOX51300.1 hypothetical protein [Fibrobacteria bacterium]